jgi:hypothetical protein
MYDMRLQMGDEAFRKPINQQFLETISQLGGITCGSLSVARDAGYAFQ